MKTLLIIGIVGVGAVLALTQAHPRSYISYNSQCQNCRYDSYESNYCCYNGLDRSCCRYASGGSNNGNVGGSGSYNPGNVGGSGSYNPGGYNGNNNNNNGGQGYQKPGSCPSSSYGRRRREAPPSYPSYPNGGNNGQHRPPYTGNNKRCNQDQECPGNDKCCYDSYSGYRKCTRPNGNYYG